MLNTRKIKKIASLGTIGLLASGALVGCTQKFTQEQVDQKIADAKSLQKQTLDKQYQEDFSKALEDQKQTLKEVYDARLNAQKESDEETARILQEELDKLKAEKAEADEEHEVDYFWSLQDDIELNSFVKEDTLTTSDLPKLLDTEIRFNDDTYDVREEFEIDSDSVKVGTSLEYDEEFKEVPYLVFEKEDSLKYRFVFEDPVLLKDISNDEPLEIQFLGQPMKIVDAKSGELTLRKGLEKTLTEGETVSFSDELPEVKLLAVTSNKVSVEVNGDVQSIFNGDEKEVGGIHVAVDEILYQDYAGGIHAANLFAGDDVQQTVKEGEEYVEDDETFLWGLVTSGTGDDKVLEEITLTYHPKGNDLEDEDEPVYKAGEKIAFPNDYLVVEFDLEKSYKYAEFEVDFHEAGENDTLAFRIKSSEDRTLKVGTEELDLAYINDTTVFYKDSDNDWQQTDEELKVDFGDTDFDITYSPNELDFGGIKINTEHFEFLGEEEDDSELTDVVYKTENLGTKDYDVLLSNGFVVKNPENNADRDEVKILVPDDEVQAVLKVGYKKG